ncbi:Disease resistance protein, partial [Quillaja saponaria]
VLFPNLERLNLSSMKRTIWDHQISPNFFPKLKSLEVTNCQKLVTIFPSDLVSNFQNLETLKVKKCISVEKIFGFRQLHDGKTLAGGIPFQNIRTLEIDSCDGLIDLVTFSTVKSTLVQLQKLSITNCEMIEVIISSSDQGQNVEDDEIAFPRLNSLELFNLPNLKSFCSQKSILQFSSLKEVIVSVCPKMEMFSPCVVDAPLFKGVISHKLDDQILWKGDLNSTIRKLFMEMLEEMAKGFPCTINHPLHEKHQLLLARRTYQCDGCRELAGYCWSYVCGRCDFDLHPTCALKGSNKAIN